MRHPDAARQGFTLLESTIAVAILALALPLLFQAVGSATSNLSSIERRSEAWRLASDVMTEHVATLDGSTGTQEGSTDDLVWRVETARADEDVKAAVAGGAENALFQVTVTVRPHAGANPGATVTLETLALVRAAR